VAGVTGSLTASQATPGKDEDTSPLGSGQIGYLAVLDDRLVLYRAKRGAFKPKPTEDVIASAPRLAVGSAEVERKKLAGVLEVVFTDGTSWTFDVPKVHLSTAEGVARAVKA
jgi:hypothetical protein